MSAEVKKRIEDANLEDELAGLCLRDVVQSRIQYADGEGVAEGDQVMEFEEFGTLPPHAGAPVSGDYERRFPVNLGQLRTLVEYSDKYLDGVRITPEGISLSKWLTLVDAALEARAGDELADAPCS